MVGGGEWWAKVGGGGGGMVACDLGDAGVFIDRDEDLVEQGFQVVTHHSVHHEALQWGDCGRGGISG